MVMFVKTKDVLKSQTHVTHPHVVPVQLAHQIALEIQFVGKTKHSQYKVLNSNYKRRDMANIFINVFLITLGANQV